MTNEIIAKLREWSVPMTYEDITEARDALYGYLYEGEAASDLISEVIGVPATEGHYDEWAEYATNVTSKALTILDRWLEVFGRAALEAETVNSISYYITSIRNDHEKIESVHLAIQRHWREVKRRG